jgi:threonylcarbamoyladenosine tRNA methylthiotransferase MtaB
MKVFLDSVGCRLNQGEIEFIGSQLRESGWDLVPNAESSDLVILNTCAVTSAAAADSRGRARDAHRRNGKAKLVLTGCWASLAPAQAAALPGHPQVVTNDAKGRLASTLLGRTAAPSTVPDRLGPVPGARFRTRAFIKVQDGCDHTCTYCITRVARGQGRSTPVEEVVAQVNAAQSAGAEEAVLSGVSLGSYGTDLAPTANLATLLKTLLQQTDIARIRLSSVEPWTLPVGLLELWQDERLCRQLHLPLQSGSASTLKRMARPITPDGFARLVERARATIPGLAITTDLIAGFPGETRAEFKETQSFVEQMGFAGGHVFVYSPRPGTPATRLHGRVPVPLAKERSRQLRALLEASRRRFQARFIGRCLNVLWESSRRAEGGGRTEITGWTDNYLRVAAPGAEGLLNQISRTQVTGMRGRELLGRILGGADG